MAKKYNMVKTPNLPVGHLLMTDKELKDLRQKTRKRSKKGRKK